MKATLIWALALCLSLSGCKKDNNDNTTVTPTPAKPDYQMAIDAKYVVMGWDKDGHSADNGGKAVQTKANKGWVQYYTFGNRKTAIYYFAGQGAYAMDTGEMTKYDALGQDTFGYVSSDPKPAGTGYGYNEIVHTAGDDNSAGIILGALTVYGEIYKKYLALNRWDGPLGYPTSDELDLSSKRGRFNAFTKGQIYWGASTGAQAFWGKVDQMYKQAGYDGGWLGLPKTSCDPTKSDYVVLFEHGSIGVGSGCNDYNNGGYYTDQNGKVGGHPCY